MVMKSYLRSVFLLCGFACLSVHLLAQNAYITNNTSNNISIINTVTDSVIGTIEVGVSPDALVISPDGTRLYLTYNMPGKNVITVVNTQTRQAIADIPISVAKPSSTAVELSTDGTTLYVPLTDTVYVYNTTTYALITKLAAHPNAELDGMVASPDGKNIYAAGNGIIYRIDAATNVFTDSIVSPDSYYLQMAMSPDSKTLYAVNWVNGVLESIDLATRQSTHIQVTNIISEGVTVSPDGLQAYVTNYLDASVGIINTATSQLIKTVKVGDNPYGISITPDGTKVYVANYGSDKVSVISTLTNTVVNNVAVGAGPLAFGKFISTGSTLPVRLVSFTASLVSHDAKLQWQTAEETNTSHFNIERSADGIHFSTIGNVSAGGNSSLPHTYVYTDLNVESLTEGKTIWYRLQTIDKEGSVSAGNIVSVMLPAQTAAMRLLANPVHNSLTVNLSKMTGTVQCSVVAMSGKRVMELTKTITEAGMVSINASALPAGIYILTLTGKNVVLQQKFVKE